MRGIAHGTAPVWSAAVTPATSDQPLEYLTTVHPCFIDGVRTLVHKRGLKQHSQDLFQRLKAYAQSHGFALREDRRKRELTCRDERRRLAPILMFAAGLLSQGLHAEDGGLRDKDVTVVPTIDVIGERVTTDRAYLIEAGKRFVSKPHGSVELILGIANEVRAKGDKHRVRTRGIHMPSEYTDSFVDRYDYVMPTSCGGETFSFYEGEGFAALGYHAGHGEVILDVLAGGGPFSAPRLWGPYDQVLNANIRMDLMMGDGLKDGMGVLQASYKIGLVPVMRTATKNYYGELYSRAVLDAAECVMPNSPEVRQAGTDNAPVSDDHS
jgi:hypothetical protein